MAKVLAFIVLVVAVNVALRFVDLPDVDLPSFDVPDWLRQLNLVKNVIIAALIALAVIGAMVKSRDH